MTKFSCALLFLLTSLYLTGQSPNKSFIVKQINEEVIIDGLLDEKFWETDLNNEGLAFAQAYYETDDYFEDYEAALSSNEPTLYHVKDSWSNYQKLEPLITSAFKNWRNSTVNSITSATDGAVYLSDIDTTSVGRIFNGRLSYNKGAMVLHMLREKLGDSHFFQGLKNYLSDSNLAYGYAKTPDLIAHLETVSKLDLEEFFKDWVYNQGYPTYNIEWNQTSSTSINIELNQIQSHNSVSFFEANVPIRLHGTNSEVLDVYLNNTSSNQTFLENVNFTVSSLEIDPDFHLISKNNNVTLSVDNNAFLSEKITLFPNPIEDILTIKTSENFRINKLIIYNSLGKEILESTNKEINLNQLSSGIYFIKVITDYGDFYKKIAKN